MVIFVPHGPFVIDPHVGTNGRMIRKAEVAEFWTHHPSLKGERGVYIFGIRSGGGTTPIYVGKTEDQDFEREAFTSHKRDHYNIALHDYAKGTPLLFFLALPRAVGAPNLAAIDALETDLIAECLRVNPELANTKKRPKPPGWAIEGLLRSGSGRPSAAATALRSVLKL
jgi:hypothetical protein